MAAEPATTDPPVGPARPRRGKASTAAMAVAVAKGRRDARNWLEGWAGANESGERGGNARSEAEPNFATIITPTRCHTPLYMTVYVAQRQPASDACFGC